jgi:hypothetical protein
VSGDNVTYLGEISVAEMVEQMPGARPAARCEDPIEREIAEFNWLVSACRAADGIRRLRFEAGNGNASSASFMLSLTQSGRVFGWYTPRDEAGRRAQCELQQMTQEELNRFVDDAYARLGD